MVMRQTMSHACFPRLFVWYFAFGLSLRLFVFPAARFQKVGVRRGVKAMPMVKASSGCRARRLWSRTWVLDQTVGRDV